MDEYTYTYNADGIRTGKNLSGSVVQYVLDGSRIVSEQRDSRILIYLYDEAGSPIGIKYRAGNFAAGVYRYYFFEKNLQGDIIAIYTENGTKICTYTYDAWGKVITTLESGTAGHEVYISNYNPFRYRGYYYDTETGWYYLQTRYYNPTWGRFLNADNSDVITATPDQLTDKNLYAYCDNNPVMRMDDGGEFWGAITGAIIGAISGGISAAINGDNVWAGIGIGATTGAISGLAVDLSIATGGLAGLAIAATGGALSSIASDVSNGLVNDNMPSVGEIFGNATLAAASNMLSFGMGLDSGVKTGAKSIRTMFSNAKSNFRKTAITNAKGKFPKNHRQKLTNIGKNTAKEFAQSAAYDGIMQGFKFIATGFFEQAV